MNCEFDHPHDHPCGRKFIAGVTRCEYCGHIDGSADCTCWTPATPAHLDALYAEAWGIADPGAKPQ